MFPFPLSCFMLFHFNAHRFIEIKKECLSENVEKALAAAITDLHMGFLAVGGLTAIGRGLFKVEEININGKVVDWEENTMYSSTVNALGGVK